MDYLNEQEEDYTPYVPIKKRKEAQLAKLESRHIAGSADRKRKQELDEDEDEQQNGREGPKGNATTLLIEAQEVKRLKAIAGQSGNIVASTRAKI